MLPRTVAVLCAVLPHILVGILSSQQAIRTVDFLFAHHGSILVDLPLHAKAEPLFF